MKQHMTKQRGVYRIADDRWMVPMIRKLVDQRPTYGYRRIQVLLNRKLKALDRPGVNHKRVYRIMKQNNMLLSRYTGNRPMRAHDGAVITLRSNMRWCSDVFEIGCSNAEIVLAQCRHLSAKERNEFTRRLGAVFADFVKLMP